VLEPVHAPMLVRLRLPLGPRLPVPVLRLPPGGPRRLQRRLGPRERRLCGLSRRTGLRLAPQGRVVLHAERAELLLPFEDARSARRVSDPNHAAMDGHRHARRRIAGDLHTGEELSDPGTGRTLRLDAVGEWTAGTVR